MNKLALIDADGLIYHSLRDSLQESLSVIDEKILNIFEKTEATHYVLFISQGKYFRHNLFPEYKISRDKYRNNPSSKWFKVLKQYLIAEWNAQWMDNVEADDLVAYWYNQIILYNSLGAVFQPTEKLIGNIYQDKAEKMEKIICSPDKDLLQSIPGKHFNYSYKLEDKTDLNSIVKGWWVETKSKLEADYFIWKQMLMGDSADGIPCLSKVGEKTAEKLLSDYENYDLGVFNKYLDFYGTSKGIYEFQKNYRLLHMLDCDEDFVRECQKLPSFPIISETKKVAIDEDF